MKKKKRADFGKAKRKVVRTAAGALAAASVVIGSLFASPDDLMQSEDAFAVSCTAPAAQIETDDGTRRRQSAQTVKKSVAERMRGYFLSRPYAVRGVVVLPLWALGKGVLTLGSTVLTALSPFFQGALGFLLNALLLLGVFLLLYKLVFPHASVKKLLSRKNLILMCSAALFLTAADALLKLWWEDYSLISAAIKAGVGLVCLTLIAFRVFGKRKKPAAA